MIAGRIFSAFICISMAGTHPRIVQHLLFHTYLVILFEKWPDYHTALLEVSNKCATIEWIKQTKKGAGGIWPLSG